MMAFRRYSLAILFLFLYQYLSAQDKETAFITLKPQRSFYSPKYMHITAVKDDRTDTAILGYINTGLMQHRTPVSLHGGVANAINSFILSNTNQDMSAPALEMHISQLEVSQKSIGMKKQQDIEIVIAFYQQGEKRIEFSGSNYIQFTDNAAAIAEQLIRQAIEHCLKEGDKWVERNRNTILSSPQVNAIVEMGTEPEDGNNIIYSKDRPLSFEDFRGKPDAFSSGTALTYSTIGVRMSGQVKGNVTNLRIIITPSFNKKGSWYRKERATPAILKHEQVHFDITAINTCEFINAVKAFTFSPSNYEQELRELQQKYEQQTSEMQEQYDEETQHSIITAKQQQWEKRIADKLAEQNCF